MPSLAVETCHSNTTRDTVYHKALLLSFLVSLDLPAVQVALQRAVDNKNAKLMVAAAEAGRQLILRQLELYKCHSKEAVDTEAFFLMTDQATQLVQHEMETDPSDVLALVSALLRFCGIMANVEAASQVLMKLIVTKDVFKERPAYSDQVRSFYETVSELSEVPCVRIINLKRRKDRRRCIMAQALREKLFVSHAVASLVANSETRDANDGWMGGGYALDGSGRMAEARSRLLKRMGGAHAMNLLVDVNWRPNDLKPFDRDAPNDEALVRMSETEVACALSHIASWKGALRSLQLTPPPWASGDADNGTTANKLFDHPLRVLRGLRTGGFASGPALLIKNAEMSPAAVVVILEDDAILVDRFRERLDELLKELPRDFHFCSIGYSRPKTAPIIPYSSQCGIPSHLFYMTGYLLSHSGAEYLLSLLPVVGPVDAFVGLKMTSNWGNVYGEAVGVGIQSKPISDPVATEDIARVLKFRAFCAMTPLCSQRVGTATASTGRAWRQRDTDIQYSGDIRRASASNGNKNRRS
jgi:hypothetical protein